MEDQLATLNAYYTGLKEMTLHHSDFKEALGQIKGDNHLVVIVYLTPIGVRASSIFSIRASISETEGLLNHSK